jgi:hypothetical protein
MEMPMNMFAILAIVMAMGLVGVVAVDLMTDVQYAEARGCINDHNEPGRAIAGEASKLHCVR